MTDEFIFYECPSCHGTGIQHYQKCCFRICWSFMHECSYPEKKDQCVKDYKFETLGCYLCKGAGKITWVQRVFLNE